MCSDCCKELSEVTLFCSADYSVLGVAAFKFDYYAPDFPIGDALTGLLFTKLLLA